LSRCLWRSARRLTAWIPQVLEYCENHRGEPRPITDEANAEENRKWTNSIGNWRQKFITVDQEMFDILLAADYLDIEPLLGCVVSLSTPVVLDLLILLRNDVGCMTVASAIKGKTPEGIWKFSNIVNDFTPEEEVRGPMRCLDPPPPPLTHFLIHFAVFLRPGSRTT